MSTFKSRKYVLVGKKRVIYHAIVQEIKFKHMVKRFRHIETYLSQNKPFSGLVSTLNFVLARGVQLPLESAHSLFSYTPSK